MIVAPLLAYEALRRRRVREVFAGLAVAFGALGEAIEMARRATTAGEVPRLEAPTRRARR